MLEKVPGLTEEQEDAVLLALVKLNRAEGKHPFEGLTPAEVGRWHRVVGNRA